MTDRTGEYSVALSPGTYQVDVTRFGYDDMAMTVQIRAGDTVRKDLELVASPRVRVRGRVTDGSGHGWPLYARVDLPGTPVRTFSDPETGRFELSVPAGHSYRLRTVARYEGYRTHTEDLTVDGPMTHDVGVPVDPTTCTAPGYERTGGLSEDFESAGTTDRWSVEDKLGNAQTWTFGDLGGRGNLTGGTGGFAVVDSDHYGADGTQDTALVSPSVDLGDATAPVLEFATEFRRYWSTSAEVDCLRRRRRDVEERMARPSRPCGDRGRSAVQCPRQPARTTYACGSTTCVRVTTGGGRSTTSSWASRPARPQTAGWSSDTRGARSPGVPWTGSRCAAVGRRSRPPALAPRTTTRPRTGSTGCSRRARASSG